MIDAAGSNVTTRLQKFGRQPHGEFTAIKPSDLQNPCRISTVSHGYSCEHAHRDDASTRFHPKFG
jgi:hypothetical protein